MSFRIGSSGGGPHPGQMSRSSSPADRQRPEAGPGESGAHGGVRHGGSGGARMGPAVARRVLITLVVLLAAGFGATLAVRAAVTAEQDRAGGSGPAVASAAGDIRIGNSRRGRAVLSAESMLPGDSAGGRVRISNPNRQPMRLSLALDGGNDRLGRALGLMVRDPNLQGDSTLYSGSPGSMPTLPLGGLAPGSSRTFDFSAALPADAGNSLQGRDTSFNLAWSATAAGPPPECKLRGMRARLFVFRKRNVIRLVSRYRARVAARIAIVFYERRRGGRPGRPIGRLITRFRRSPRAWQRNRVATRRPPRVMRRLRHSRRGYYATIRVSNTPGYCRQYLNLDLVQLKRFFRQYVWFQRGSFQTRRR